jgi:hypothetical protein
MLRRLAAVGRSLTTSPAVPALVTLTPISVTVRLWVTTNGPRLAPLANAVVVVVLPWVLYQKPEAIPGPRPVEVRIERGVVCRVQRVRDGPAEGLSADYVSDGLRRARVGDDSSSRGSSREHDYAAADHVVGRRVVERNPGLVDHSPEAQCPGVYAGVSSDVPLFVL